METLSLEALELLNSIENELDIDIEDDEDECGWGLYGWEGPDED